ncbi:IS3 family transposase [Corynebacterium diphtheriae]|nr:IS3 family transposase [Corynebacterium diphtheriae]
MGTANPRARGLSARRLRDAALIEKMWHALLHRQDIDIGREHKARLMRSAGLFGKGKGGAPVTTRQSKGSDLRPDLVNQAIVCANETTGLIHHLDHG